MPALHRPVLRTLALASVIAVAGAACSSDPSDSAATTTAPATTAPPTTAGEATTTTAPAGSEKFDIVGTALSAVVFTQLAGMVVDAGLVDTLRTPGPFTVFAPTDDAFAKLPLETLHAVQDDPDTLATVLTYHVVPGALKLADLKDGKLTTVAGLDLTVSHQGDTVLINGFPIAAGDIEATNGIIHVMDDVLVPG